MTLFMRSGMRSGFGVAAGVLLLLAAGCSSDSGGRDRPAGPRGRPFTPMAGEEMFFGGQIRAEIHVGTDGMPEVQPGGSGGGGGESSRGSGGRGRRGGGGGGRMGMQGGGGGGVAGEMSGSMPFGEGGRAPRELGGPGAGRPMMAGGRPVMIHLRFTNQGTTPVELRINDFMSPLGNFAVRPERLTLDPGQSLETEPMSSQLAGAFSETMATLVLHVGGQTEKKTFPLRALPPPPPAAPSPPPLPEK